MWTWTLLTRLAAAQTIEQQEESLYYLRKTACIDDSGPTPAYDPPAPLGCWSDDDCPSTARCLHRSVITGPETWYPELEFVTPPTELGSGEGVVRYIPLCEDGSGDHEYSVSGGQFGTPPTCAPDDFIRCGDGSRPWMRIAPGTTNHWVVNIDAGGHASSPTKDELSIWHLQNIDGNSAAYSNPVPTLLGDLNGIVSADPTNPFVAFQRVSLEKCTADTGLGNRAFHDLQDATTDTDVHLPVGRCIDANGDGRSDWIDELDVPGSCPYVTRRLAPPMSPNHEYSVYYHGKRIARAMLADLAGGATAFRTYPLVDDGTGQAALAPGDVRLPRPDVRSRIALHTHSHGANGMQGGHIDELHELADRMLGGDVDVRMLFNSAFLPGYEVEWAMSEWDGQDLDGDGLADSRVVIDDTRSIYDHVVDTVSMTGEPMSDQAWAPGGDVLAGKIDWFEPRPGYAPPVDASCLAHHCPGSADWTADPACTPCNSSTHVVLNHLQTPYFYNVAQSDNVWINLARQCEDASTGETTSCDFDGSSTGTNLVDSHYRHGVRKQMADLARDGATERCEAATGEAPYDRLLLVSPDWSRHESIAEDVTASKRLDLEGPAPEMSLAEAAWRWVMHDFGPNPHTTLCLQERTPGENAADFGPGVPGCR